MGVNDHTENLTLLCTEAARQIVSECGKSEDVSSSPGLQGCGTPFVDLLGRQAARILDFDDTLSAPSKIDRRLSDLIEIAHARFYAFVPHDVPVCWQQLYTDASILRFAQRWLTFARCVEERNENESTSLPDPDTLIRPLDMALILAGGVGPSHRGRAWIHAALDELHALWDGNEAGAKAGEREDDGESADSAENETTESSDRPNKRRRTETSKALCHDWSSSPTFDEYMKNTPSPFVPPVGRPIPRSGPLGLEGFQAYLDQYRKRVGNNNGSGGTAAPGGPQPLILAGMTDHWPARRRSAPAAGDGNAHPWSVPEYLRWRTIGGHRLVPVELGRSYVDDGWTQAVVPFSDVLDELLGTGRKEEDKSRPVGRDGPMYLAQHALFSQMPRLREDIIVPDACYTIAGDTDGGGDDCEDDSNDVLINAWLGPPGTITPLHTDPHHNLLAQVVGRKYVRLYAPEQTAALRPRGTEAGGIDMGNTSTLDVGVAEGWDQLEDTGDDDDRSGQSEEEQNEHNERKHEQFRQIPYVDCILEPGDTLYIPQGWWHYVRGLTVSFSVSFWWN